MMKTMKDSESLARILEILQNNHQKHTKLEYDKSEFDGLIFTLSIY